MMHVIQVSLFAAAFAVTGMVLVDGLTSPRARAVLRQLLTGEEG